MGTKRLALKMVMLLSMMAEGVQAVAGKCELLFLWFVFDLWCGVLIVIFLYSEEIFDFQHLTLNLSSLATITWTLVLLDVLSFGRCNLDALTLNNFF
jgi:hypothetical protein